MASQWPSPPLHNKDVSGFRALKVESIALAVNGSRLFAGTSDGVLVMYECRVRPSNVELVQISQLLGARSTSKDKKPVSNLIVVDDWRALLGIMDTCLTVYDIHTCRQLVQSSDTKGAVLVSVHQKSGLIVVATKKKQLLVYTWAGGLSSSGPLISRGSPLSLAEIPSCMCCVGDSVVVGYKKAYNLVNLSTGVHTKVLDSDRLGICLEIPPSPIRPPRLLLSSGNRGIFVDMQTWTISDESISWTSPPLQGSIATPFILTCSERCIEVHDLSLLQLAQIIPLSPPEDTRALATASLHPSPALHDHIYLSGKDTLSLFSIDGLDIQVNALVKANQYLAALGICELCPEQAEALGIQVSTIHERFAANLLSKGDYDAAVGHFLQAKTSPFQVLKLFPTFYPAKLPIPPSAKGMRPLSSSSSSSGFASPKAAERAAQSIVRFLENHRNSATVAADDVERKRRRQGVANTFLSEGGMGDGLDSSDLLGGGRASYQRNLRGSGEDDEEEVLATAVMVDTVLVVTRLLCNPARKWDIIDLLKRPNRCHEASCLPLLAERGVPYAEALLHLYRSVGAHERVLANLVEDRCVGKDSTNGWSKEQFFNWKADYLRTLWHSNNTSETKLVLTSHQGDPPLVSLLKSDPLLGLKVLMPKNNHTQQNESSNMNSNQSKGSVQQAMDYDPIGGLGFTIKVVVHVLKDVIPKQSTASGDGPIPLSAPNGLALAYLEALVNSTNHCPAEAHDELGLLLMEAAMDNEGDFIGNKLKTRLRDFLLTSSLYDPNRFLQELPPNGWSHEKALILSRLGQHGAVLRIYVHELHDIEAAEAYCDRIYKESEISMLKQNVKKMSLGGGGGGAEMNEMTKRDDDSSADVYLDLMKVYLSDELGSPDLQAVVKLLNKHFTRVSPVKVLTALPSSTPLALLSPYLGKAMRHLDSQRRSTLVRHGLLKVHFLNLSHEVTQRRIEQLSDMAQVPALARLGSPSLTLPPITLSEDVGNGVTPGGSVVEHEVKCIRHMFDDSHMVFQFEVKNNMLNGSNMSHVNVRVVASDDDLYKIEKEIELPFLPFSSSGSCYVVLREKKQTMGTVNTSFSCDLCYDDHVLPLQNIEVTK